MCMHSLSVTFFSFPRLLLINKIARKNEKFRETFASHFDLWFWIKIDLVPGVWFLLDLKKKKIFFLQSFQGYKYYVFVSVVDDDVDINLVSKKKKDNEELLRNLKLYQYCLQSWKNQDHVVEINLLIKSLQSHDIQIWQYIWLVNNNFFKIYT